MTRLLTCGYETNDVNEAGTNTIGTNGTLTVVGSTPTPRAGNACLKVAGGTTFTLTYKAFNMGAAKTDVWVRFAVFIHPLASTQEYVFAAMRDAGIVDQTCLTWDPTTASIRARRDVAIGGTLLATGSTPMPPDSWHVIDWRVQITSGTAGTVEVWLDGNRIINFSGDNTQTSTLNVQFLLLGMMGTIGTATGIYVAYDDIAINDTAGTVNNGRAGDGRVVLLSPSGAGSTTQFVRGGTDTGANFSQVNEVPPSLTQYVGSPTVGNRDLYALADLPVVVQSINVVEVLALAQNSDAGGGSLAPTLKSGATTNEATVIGLSTSAGYITGRWETDPNGGGAWTAAAVNALEAGATVR